MEKDIATALSTEGDVHEDLAAGRVAVKGDQIIPSASIFLIDDDPVHAERFSQHLRVCRYSVTLCSEPAEAIQMLSRPDSSWRVIIWNVSRSSWDCLTMLRAINDIYQQNPLRRKPRILCFSSVDRGTQFRLDIKRLGAWLIYE